MNSEGAKWMLGGRESSPVDLRILQIVEELRVQLDIRLAYRKISWQNRISEGRGSRLLPSDEPEIGLGRIILPQRMQERLDPDDWRPLIASSLVYQIKLSGAKFRHVMKRWVLGVILPLSILATLLVILFWPRSEIGIPGIILAIFIMVAISANYISAPYLKRVRLQADRVAADMVGRNTFLQVLRKIDKLGVEDLVQLERQGALKARFTGRPTMTERIENLSSSG